MCAFNDGDNKTDCIAVSAEGKSLWSMKSPYGHAAIGLVIRNAVLVSPTTVKVKAPRGVGHLTRSLMRMCRHILLSHCNDVDGTGTMVAI